jgi:polar amino acid transport system substrate-binding protein
MGRRRAVTRSTVALAATALVLAAGGCSFKFNRSAPSPEVRQVLAPAGKLRVGVYPGSPTSVIGDPASGDAKGVGYDVGRALANRMGVPFEPVVFARNAEVLAAVKAGKVDMTFTNATPARAQDMDFSPPVLQVEQGYLVPRGSRVTSINDVDRPGIRVGVSQGSTSESVLSQALKNVELVRAPTIKVAIEMLASGKLDAFATNKAILFEMSDELAGSKVLPGRWGMESFAIGIPKGREQGMPYIRKFVADIQADGLIDRAVDRAGLRGTVSAAAAR